MTRPLMTRPDILAGYLRQGFGVEDAKVRFRLTYGIIAGMLRAYPDLAAHARIARSHKQSAPEGGMRSDIVDITIVYQTRTEKAVCVREVEDGPDVWLPLSAVEIEAAEDGGLRRGRPAVLTGPERLLTEKGLL